MINAKISVQVCPSISVCHNPHTPQNSLTDYPINSPARHKPKCDTANNVLVSESERDPINTSALPFASDCNSAWHLLWFVTLLELVKTSLSVVVALIISNELRISTLDKNKVLYTYKLFYGNKIKWISTKTILTNIIFFSFKALNFIF